MYDLLYLFSSHDYAGGIFDAISNMDSIGIAGRLCHKCARKMKIRIKSVIVSSDNYPAP